MLEFLKLFNIEDVLVLLNFLKRQSDHIFRNVEQILDPVFRLSRYIGFNVTLNAGEGLVVGQLYQTQVKSIHWCYELRVVAYLPHCGYDSRCRPMMRRSSSPDLDLIHVGEPLHLRHPSRIRRRHNNMGARRCLLDDPTLCCDFISFE